jgi:3-mercaptopyruvate sulfurtransferase SseA
LLLQGPLRKTGAVQRDDAFVVAREHENIGAALAAWWLLRLVGR